MEYHFTSQAKEIIVGSQEYRLFRVWLESHYNFSTRMRLTSLKPEYLAGYLEEYLKRKNPDHS